MVKKNFIFLILASLLLFWQHSFSIQQYDRSPFPVTQFALKNGLQVILSEDYSLPIVSVVMAYKVGSIHEQPGKTGLARLLENLMFQGSRNIGQMQHISFIQKIGGVLNAATTADKTIFYQTVPSNQLALVLWLESDRMNSLSINAANVEKIKSSLIEELQIRKDTDPYLQSSWDFDKLLFPNFTYSHPALGTIADIREITAKDVRDFYSSYYTPSNAVLSIVGQIDKSKVRQLLEKYFSTIPIGNDPPSPSVENLPKIEETIQTIINPLAPSPAYHLGYQIAPRYSDDYYPLAVIEYILLRGETSRLHRRLIAKDRTAIHLSGGIERKVRHSAFKIFVRINNEIMRERSQKALFSEINKLKSTMISEQELNKSKNMLKMDYLMQHGTVLDKAIFLAEKTLEVDEQAEWSDELDRYLSVTGYDILRTLNKYFNDGRILLDIKIR
jgi:zinc protease